MLWMMKISQRMIKLVYNIKYFYLEQMYSYQTNIKQIKKIEITKNHIVNYLYV